MEKPRVVSNLLATYRRVAGDQGKTPPTTSIQTIKNWCTRKKWIDRAEAFDGHQGAIAIQEAAKQQRIANQKEIDIFIQFNRESGKAGCTLTAQIKKELSEFARGLQSNQPASKGANKIRSWEDATRAARVIAAIEPSSAEMWAKAIGVDHILSNSNG